MTKPRLTELRDGAFLCPAFGVVSPVVTHTQKTYTVVRSWQIKSPLLFARVASASESSPLLLLRAMAILL